MKQIFSLSPLDYFIFFFILLITFLAAIWGNRKKKTAANRNESELNLLDYILMGRSLSLPLFVATLVATWYGGIFGVTRISYESGIYNFLTQGVFWYVTYLIMAFYFVDKIRSYNVLTLPELVENLFGKKAGKIAAVFNFFNVVPIAYTLSLGIFLQTMFGGSLFLYSFIGVLFVIAYSSISGFRSVVYSDFIQFFVMCSAVFLVVVVSVYEFGGLEYLKANVPASHFEWTGQHSWGTTLVWGFIALSTLVDPNFYQRIFAAKNPLVAKRGILISTLIWCCFDLCTTFGGIYAYAYAADLDPTNAYMIYSLNILPEGLRGFFLAGILATILSTIDSYLFIASNTLSYDFVSKSEKRLHKKRLHSLSLLFVGLLSCFIGIFFEGNIRQVWKTFGSYSAGCLLLPITFSLYFPKKISERDFIIMVVASLIAISIWRFIPRQGFWINVDSLYIGLGIQAILLVVLTSPIFRRKRP